MYLVQGLLVWMVQGKGLWDWIWDGAVQSDLFWVTTCCGSFSGLFWSHQQTVGYQIWDLVRWDRDSVPCKR